MGPSTNYLIGLGRRSVKILFMIIEGGVVGDIYNELFNFISISILNFFSPNKLSELDMKQYL